LVQPWLFLEAKPMESTALDDRIAQLEGRTQRLRPLLGNARRAFVIEFAGTPKSGKSTSIEAIRHFFTRQGFRVHVLIERASTCPIPMKGHLFFNTWCAASMLAELLANVETETDIIIVDRGILDALVWLVAQERRGEVTSEEARIIESFLLLDRWRSLIDLGVVMNVDADEAMRRENSMRITAKPGSVMNHEALTAVTESVSVAVDRFASKFPKIVSHDTAGLGIRESLVLLADKIVDAFHHFLNPEVLVVPRQQIALLSVDHGGAFDKHAVERAVQVVRKHGHFMLRDEAERNFEQVQIVSCGFLEHDHKVFVFERRDADPKYRLYGKATVLQGSHVWKREGAGIPERLELALLEKLSESLFLSRVFPTEAIGFCWDKDDEISRRHFGVVYRVKIDNPHTALNLQRKEFRKRRGHGFTGQFQDFEQVLTPEVQNMLESWSHAVLFGVGIEK
jgi:predicted NUDIX family phosphoesterase